MRDRELKDRWQIFEHLKETNGMLDVSKLKSVSGEITEGIAEYLFWMDKQGR